MKRILLLALVPLLLCACSGCAVSAADYYDHAHLYLGGGDYESAAMMFTQLGEYKDAANLALYCTALDELEKGNLSLAQADLEQVHPFKSSDRYLRLIDAMVLQENGDLEGALSIYEALGSFAGSPERAEALREKIPQRDLAHAQALMSARRWEQALDILTGLGGYGSSEELIIQCRQNITLEAYEQAEHLYEAGEYAAALSAFENLGDVLDAKAWVTTCREAMYQQLEGDFLAASLSNAESLMARYGEMEDYQQSPARLQALQTRYAVNLALLDKAYERPYARFGDLLWRVILVENGQATLLCQEILPASTSDLMPELTVESHKAILSYDFPRLVLDLEQYAFTRGQGTAADPYQ